MRAVAFNVASVPPPRWRESGAGAILRQIPRLPPSTHRSTPAGIPRAAFRVQLPSSAQPSYAAAITSANRMTFSP